MSDVGLSAPILQTLGGVGRIADLGTGRSTVAGPTGVPTATLADPAAVISGGPSNGVAAGLATFLQEPGIAQAPLGAEENGAGTEAGAGNTGNAAATTTPGDSSDGADSAEEAAAEGEGGGTGPNDLTEEEQRIVAELQRRDAEVRRHEQAHASVGGQYAGAPTYTTVRGPDGRSYAVAGEVRIDASPVPGNPRATIAKMQIVQRAALAPTNPSATDRRVASQAQQQIAQARLEIQQEITAERTEARQRAEEVREANLQAATEGDSVEDGSLGVATPNALPSVINAPDTGQAAADAAQQAAASVARLASAGRLSSSGNASGSRLNIRV